MQIRFAAGGQYRSSDYWLIPARVTPGGVLWPSDSGGQPELLPPAGIEHHYAPLGLVRDNAGLQVDPCGRCGEVPETACRAPSVAPRDKRPTG